MCSPLCLTSSICLQHGNKQNFYCKTLWAISNNLHHVHLFNQLNNPYPYLEWVGLKPKGGGALDNFPPFIIIVGVAFAKTALTTWLLLQMHKKYWFIFLSSKFLYTSTKWHIGWLLYLYMYWQTDRFINWLIYHPTALSVYHSMDLSFACLIFLSLYWLVYNFIVYWNS